MQTGSIKGFDKWTDIQKDLLSIIVENGNFIDIQEIWEIIGGLWGDKLSEDNNIVIESIIREIFGNLLINKDILKFIINYTIGNSTHEEYKIFQKKIP